MSHNFHLMLFDLAVSGHHSAYIQHLIEYWRDREELGILSVVVSPEFMSQHVKIVEMTNINEPSKIQFIPVSNTEYVRYTNRKNNLLRTLLEWELYCKYAEKINPSHALLMYLDSLQAAMLVGTKSPCPFSAIYFRPTFHYQDFDNYRSSLSDTWRQWRQKLLLSTILKIPEFKNIFSLDGYAVKYIQEFSSIARVFHLPDPVGVVCIDPNQIDAFKKKIGIEKERKIFMLFGSLDKRKGIYQLLDAIKLLPIELCKSLCFLFVGSISDSDSATVKTLSEEISQSLPVQILMVNEFVPDLALPIYFQTADVILAPYQGHVGMSGIMLLSAAYQKPLILSDYGLTGHLGKKHRLGIVINSRHPSQIADAIRRVMDEETDITCYWCPDKTKDFVKMHDKEYFCSTLVKNIAESKH
jgi:glycosyltransferase involved in cell wall biosynthesis